MFYPFRSPIAAGVLCRKAAASRLYDREHLRLKGSATGRTPAVRRRAAVMEMRMDFLMMIFYRMGEGIKVLGSKSG